MWSYYGLSGIAAVFNELSSRFARPRRGRLQLLRPLLFTLILVLGSGVTSRGQTSSPPILEEASALAEYWYVDDYTDSFLEITSHSHSDLRLQPILRLSDGRSLTLSQITIAPQASVRVSLRSQAEVQQARPHGLRPTARWGDGSRANSVLGSAELRVLSPEPRSAELFSARIVAEDVQERIFFVASRFIRLTPTKSVTLEGLWWKPRPSSEVYFALLNASPREIELTILLNTGKKWRRPYPLTLAPYASRIVALRDAYGTGMIPQLGGVSLRIAPRHDGTVRGSVMARGLIVDEELGFGSPLYFQRAINNVGGDLGTAELHGVAFFGRLTNDIPAVEAYYHPHLLLRNTTPQSVRIRASFVGTEEDREYVLASASPNWTLAPLSTIHLDLEELRQRTAIHMRDGVVGVRLAYDGSATDVVGELINVDRRGGAVVYDRLRTLASYQITSESAMAFSLMTDRPTFLILKNVLSRVQAAQVRFTYSNGQKDYEFELPEIGPQSVKVVDIRKLRDSRIPDRRGQLIAANADYGAALVTSNPGSVMVVDPTYRCSDCGGPSCTDVGGGGGGGGSPAPKSYDRSPFQESCAIVVFWEARHKALDVGSRTNHFGEGVVAIEEGTVEASDIRPAGSDDFSAVVIRGNDNFLTIYGHVKPVPLVVGQPIRKGQLIGQTDNSGKFLRKDKTEGPCPNAAGRDCSHVHLARIKGQPLPVRERFEDILNRVRPSANGGRDEGEFFGIDCTQH